jgi:hypothetical protein
VNVFLEKMEIGESFFGKNPMGKLSHLSRNLAPKIIYDIYD